MLAQTYNDFEIIATDDGSTDRTADIIRQFTDPRIDFKALPVNTGISSAMNTTLARARGEYIAILNSDDYSFPDRLKNQASFLDKHPEIDAVFGMPKLISENGMPLGTAWPFTLPTEFSVASWLRHFFRSGNCLCAPAAMIRRSAYLRTGPYDPRLTNLQDFDMWIRMLVGGSNICVTADEVTAFRMRDGAQNASAFRRDSQLRSFYEYSRILRWYRTLDTETLEHIFSEDIEHGTVTTEGKTKDVWLSELALKVRLPPHSLFALDTLFETANSHEDYHRLAKIMGEVDVFGFWRERELRDTIDRQRKKISPYRYALRKRIRSLRKRLSMR